MCTVRDCRLPLVKTDRCFSCASGHAFDLARSGYLNLLQPQDRRSRQPGDTKAAVAARRRLHDSGATTPLLEAIAAALLARGTDTVLDAGCGDGYYLGSLAAQSGCSACGVDISAHAIDAAARRYPQAEWIVANADRFIPYADASFSRVMSITARMNPDEFHRVLQPKGVLLVAVPSPEDLVELRGTGRDRVERTAEHFSPRFQLETRQRVTTRASLSASAVQDILLSIYRPHQAHEPAGQTVTFSLDLLRFRPSP